MPRKQQSPDNPDAAVAGVLLQQYQAMWQQQLSLNKTIDPMKLAQLNLMALAQFTAMVGVDLGMPEEVYLQVCQAHFQNAFKTAPRFG